MNPLLLHMGLDAFSVAATSASMSMHTLLASSILFAFTGMLNYEFMGWFFIWSAFSTFLGMVLIHKIVDLTG